MQRDVVPLMVDMLDSLESFIKLDVPFLVETLTALVAYEGPLKRADVTTAEKFRRLLKAFSLRMSTGVRSKPTMVSSLVKVVRSAPYVPSTWARSFSCKRWTEMSRGFGI